MKEPDNEGLASHVGPESCGGVRKDRSRSVDRGTCGPGVESRKIQNRCADAHSVARKATPRRAVIARPGADAAGSKAPSTHERILRGMQSLWLERQSLPRGGDSLHIGSREIPDSIPTFVGVRAVNPKGARRR